jgi:hypothetical protein
VPRQNGNAKIPQAGFQIGVCGLRLQKENLNLMFPFSMDIWKAKK